METQSNPKLIGSLKHILSICNDGKEGYRNAAENVDASDLKAVLTTFSLQRSAYAGELKTLIRQQGGDPDNDEGGPLGVLHRAWIDIKTAFTVNDNKAVLEACETGERAAIEVYNDVLNDPEITDQAIRSKLVLQRTAIQQSLTHLEGLEAQYA